jgi:hypothetical protein
MHMINPHLPDRVPRLRLWRTSHPATTYREALTMLGLAAAAPWACGWRCRC